MRRQQAHLKHVPDYLLPREGKKALSSEDIGFVPLKKVDKKFRGKGGKSNGRSFRVGARKKNPLKNLRSRRKAA